MAVRPLGDARYAVDSQSGATYVVDLDAQTCTCPDHRLREETCKHMRRVAIEISTRRVPPPGKRRATCAACGVDTFASEADHREASERASGSDHRERHASSDADPPLCGNCWLEAGDVVRDGEADDRLVVARVTPDRADEVTIAAADCTVAEYEANEGYPADDLVVEAVYLGDLGRVDDPSETRRYSFPLSRLERSDDAALVDTGLGDLVLADS
jgi:hypothetical protein